MKAVPPECVSLGYINAEGLRALDDIAETAAQHGANSYIIRNDNTDERVTTPRRSVSVPNVGRSSALRRAGRRR